MTSIWITIRSRNVKPLRTSMTDLCFFFLFKKKKEEKLADFLCIVNYQMIKKKKRVYLGPVHPIVVPRPPLSFKTTSLSNSFLVSDGSALSQRFRSDQIRSDQLRSKKIQSPIFLFFSFELIRLLDYYREEMEPRCHKERPPRQLVFGSYSILCAALLHFF